MTGIVKSDSGDAKASDWDVSHSALALWLKPSQGLLHRIRTCMVQQGAHPARTLVLLPYAQLMPLANHLWAGSFPGGFVPAFETTLNWCNRMHPLSPDGSDIRFDPALDYLTAAALLRAAGLADQAQSLSGMLVAAALQLAPVAAGVHPQQRSEWAVHAQRSALVGLDSPLVAVEAAVASIAIAWVSQSAFASDCLFSPSVIAGLDCVIVVEGLAREALPAALQAQWGDKLVRLPLVFPAFECGNTDHQSVAWHACQDAEDEAQRSSACVLAHLAQGRLAVALVSTDRALTRRIRSMLEAQGVAIRDENGWKLSTSSEAARVMALLKAATWNASSDAVLGWLKQSPVFAQRLGGLEMALRRDQSREWRRAASGTAVRASADSVGLIAAANDVREALHGNRALRDWLQCLTAALQTCGMWDELDGGGPGRRVLEVLRLRGTHASDWEHWVDQSLWGTRRMDLAEFTAWVDHALEGASFSPAHPPSEQVVILPMSQMLGRPFAAVVLAGCDEVRLNPAPEPADGWSTPQRAALGLLSRAELQLATQLAWHHALQTPYCDVLWRCSDDAGEVLLPSALVQSVQLAMGSPQLATDPRPLRSVPTVATMPPRPDGQMLPLSALSASAYEDLRTCPYRFFAMRQLGLQPADELDAELGKRDFGLWLHAVLSRFHENEQSLESRDMAGKTASLDACSVATTEAMGFSDAEFLPFMAAWPAVRDGYLDWLSRHEQTGAVFAHAEMSQSQPLGLLNLIGRIDRVDQLPGGALLVLDYKTESVGKTALRVKTPMEDTQIAFYAALLPNPNLEGAYVNVGEREGTRDYRQPDIEAARQALKASILHDMERIAQGAALPALGVGVACDFCQARGLCRKDMWPAAVSVAAKDSTYG